MRLCVISSEYPPKWGGVGSVAHFQSNLLAKMGYKVDVYTREMKGVKRPNQHKNITIHEVKWLYAPMLFTTSFCHNAAKEVIKRGCDYDIVHVHSNMALMDKKYYELITCPIVSTMHGTWVGERSQLGLGDLSFSLGSVNDLAIIMMSPFFDKYEDFAISYSNAVIVESLQEMKAIKARKNARNIYGKDRIYKIPAGVDTEFFHPKKRVEGYFSRYGVPDDAKVVLTVTRLAGRKGVDKMLKSFKLVLRSVPKARNVIVGVGPQENKLKRLANELGISDKVHFVGKLPFGELEKAYASADLFAWHSHWEGLGLVISESLASGVPVISTKVGGAHEMIDFGKTGYYVPVGDIKGQAKYITKVLKDDELRADMGKLGREQMVKDWSWQAITKRYDELYKGLKGDKKKRVR